MDTCHWHMSSASTRIKLSAAANLQRPLKGVHSGWRAETRRSVLWKQWQDISSDNYFPEPISPILASPHT